MYLVKCTNDTESMRETWWSEFDSKEALERWLLYDKGYIIVGGIYKAEPVTVTAVTKDVKEVVGYHVE